MSILKITLYAVAALALSRAAFAQATLSVTPAYSFITDEAPHGAFALKNEGTEHLEVVVSAKFGVIEADPEGRSTHVTLGSAGSLGNLADDLTYFPQRLILEPGAERVVRYMATGDESGGHIALMHFQMRERAAVASDEIPEVATALSIVYNLVAPVVLIGSQGVAHVRAEVLEVSDDALALLLSNDSPFPFVGGVTVRGADGSPLGRAESAVYTRRRLDITLSGLTTDGPYTLEFDNRYRGLSESMRTRLAVPDPIAL